MAALNRGSMVERVDIQLEHDIDEQYQYQPGEIIRGQIVAHLVRSTFVQSIHLSVTGEGVCTWEDEYGETQQSVENYVNASQVLFKPQQVQRLDSGLNKFPFEYRLPENIPSSFIGKYGSITYILKAVIQGERPSDNTIATEPFLVARKSVLPDEINEGQDIQSAKTYFSMCSWGKLKMKVNLNKTGFVPGEDICLTADVQNHSPLRVTAIQGALMMNSTYHSKKNMATFKQIVNKRRDDYELDEGDSRRWQNVRIGVPPYIPESFLSCCDIIDLSYVFQFRVELVGGKELKVEIPVLIGSNPKGLEIPADYMDDVNMNWTSGPQSLLSQQNGNDSRNTENKWVIESPEFRKDDTLVANPLYQGEGGLSENKVGGRLNDFDDIRSRPKQGGHDTKL
ncbi:arrestin domain-containing protein 4-like [Dreissena polymorpha]|uniref:Arrestin C-terminal-like domain-containing protein n=1 Tax=Dreissena polymorpha TaxID=45954 RepID=A0A9D4FH98_DREPO|nr:arrestin domain-containing protein 4-like [Dreissena polymorpha]KAH3795812.1 hypothetical protein DPMN_149373 [Dreissena polymorpha]